MSRKTPAAPSGASQFIQRVVQEQPGIHFRGLSRAAHVTSAGQLRHHLDRLERQGKLVEVTDGRYKRYFTAGQHDPQLRSDMARFARVVPRRIAKLLLAHPMNRTELRRSLGCADSTLGYHLTRMVVLGDLAKNRGVNCCRYSLTSEDLVRKVLQLQGTAGAPPVPEVPQPGTIGPPAESPPANASPTVGEPRDALRGPAVEGPPS